MLQFITQQNMLFYAMAVVCAWGVISQIVLRTLYGKMQKDAVRPGTPKGKFMKQLRQRYQSSRRMKQDSMNVAVFIQKNLMEYRFLGTSLHGWKRMGGMAMVFCAALGAIGWYLGGPQAAVMNIQQNYILSAALAELLIVLSYGLTDTGFAKNCLEIVLQDNLENSCALHAAGSVPQAALADEAFAPAAGISENEAAASAEKTVSGVKKVSLSIGRKKKSEKETGAQKDKRELKQNLSRLKEGIRETAAATEVQKEKNARILKEMDPDEQERVIREVLKEFLSK